MYEVLHKKFYEDRVWEKTMPIKTGAKILLFIDKNSIIPEPYPYITSYSILDPVACNVLLEHPA